MRSDDVDDITRLLVSYTDGDRDAIDALVPCVYERLREIAHRHMRQERPEHTLGTTALVHEAYLGLVKQDEVDWQNRLHFFAIASRVMRNILVDYARKRGAQKRGGDRRRTYLDNRDIARADRADELVDLDAALDELARFDDRLARVVEYRFFGGMTAEETAEVLGVSAMTVQRDWQKAKLWLYRLLNDES